jgi:HNH endonuclease
MTKPATRRRGKTRRIKVIGSNRYTIVDADAYVPSAPRINSCGYAQMRMKVHSRVYQFSLHRLMICARPGEVVDHVNGDKLDNRTCNLRICTAQQNSRNRMAPGKANKTGVTGVTYRHGKYIAYIWVNGNNKMLGTFIDLAAAKDARRAAEITYFGVYAPRMA